MMKYIIDHDFHIHSQISRCSSDSEQTPERILRYAKENGFKQIVLTDHFWDNDLSDKYFAKYKTQGYDEISASLPLPQDEGTEFLFGCEADMDYNGVIGISPEKYDLFDFMIIAVNHMHIEGFNVKTLDKTDKETARIFIDRFERLLSYDLPFNKVGLAHFTDSLLSPKKWEDHIRIINMIPDGTYRDLFTEYAKKGGGVELNIATFKYKASDLECIFRPYRIAKECGCKFYLGSDVHWSWKMPVYKQNFQKIVDGLDLDETDKFTLKKSRTEA